MRSAHSRRAAGLAATRRQFQMSFSSKVLMPKTFAETKHFTLALQLRREFAELRPGDPIDTVEQLKSRFGVSQATVTRALDRLTREGLVHRPTGRTRLVRSETQWRGLHRVSIIRPSWPSPDYDAMVRGLMAVGQQRGWTFSLHASAADVEELDLDRTIGSNDGGILLLGAGALPDHLGSALRKPRKPVVVIREMPDNQAMFGVSLDDEQVGRLAVQHLVEQGHRRILAVISEPTVRSIHERVVGWRQEMRANGIYDSELLLDCKVTPGSDSISHTHEVFRRWLLERDRAQFSAVFCVDWTGALAVCRALREQAGLRIPRDVSIVTHAGESLLLPYLNPPLTSIEFDMKAYATASIDLLQRQFDDPRAAAEQIRIEPYLVARGSTRSILSVEGQLS